MRKLKIDTYSCNSGDLQDSLSVPLDLVKVVANILPQNISSKFDENGDQLEALLNALKSTKTKGVLLEVEDKTDNERIVISVV
ncbi:hypothetical protein AB6D24_23790 [Vibrio splendidus]